MALQISSGVLPTFLSVMARFFALLESSRVTLLGPFWMTFCLLVVRSIDGPWAFVLNISSNSSTLRSWNTATKNRFTFCFHGNEAGNVQNDGYSRARGDSYLEYPLVIDLIEDSPVDLVWFEGYPVEDGHTELCLDRFLDLNSYTGQRCVSSVSLLISYQRAHMYIHRRAGEMGDRYLGLVTHMDMTHLVARP